MSILSLLRDYGVDPCIVRMQTDDSYQTMTQQGYMGSNIIAYNAINGGAFQWAPSDFILCYYPGGWEFFELSADQQSLTPYASGLPAIAEPSAVLVTDNFSAPFWQGPLTNGQLIIGSTGASPVASSLIAGTGVTITPGAGTITISSTGGSGIATIFGNSGSITGGSVTLTGGTTGLAFAGSGSTMLMNGILIGDNGGTGVDNAGLTINLGSGSSGLVMTSDLSGNASWAAPSPAGVVSLTGTVNQVIVSGTFGTPQTGALKLTLPQDIGTTSSVTFGSLSLATPLAGTYGGTGIGNAGLTINLGSASAGYLLTSDVSGNATWQAPPSSSISWFDQGTSFFAASGNGYITTAALTATLPTGTSTGQTINFLAGNSGALIIQAVDKQQIQLGAIITAQNGTASNASQGDAITLVFDASSGIWYGINSVGNGWSLV